MQIIWVWESEKTFETSFWADFPDKDEAKVLHSPYSPGNFGLLNDVFGLSAD